MKKVVDVEPPSKSDFIKKYFPDNNWNNWRWQIKNKITSIDKLSTFINLNDDEKNIIDSKTLFNFAITPHYLKLLYDNPQSVIRKTMIPTVNELIKLDCEAEDPLNENEHSQCKSIVHRYPDRVLFLVTSSCSSYCRYCTRSRMVGKTCIDISDLVEGIEYIKQHTEIRDVLLSGGDPLTLSDDKIDWLLSEIRQIKHVQIIRIGTKIPIVMPQRIDNKLLNILKKYHPLYISIHVIHPDEISQETINVCNKLADAGIPLGSQTVLLKDINNDVQTMTNLFHELLKIRVKPYYLYQCDPIFGSSHFRTNINDGLEIINGLRGFTSGYAIPTFVIDAPGGGGKIPISKNNIINSNEKHITLQNYENNIYHYPS